MEARASARLHALPRPRSSTMLELTPPLRRLLRRHAASSRTRYDVLLDDYEPGLTTAELAGAVRRDLQRGARPARRRRPPRPGEDGRIFPATTRPEAQQRVRWTSCSQAVGYDREHWRLDPAVHPFAPQHGRTPTCG